MFSSFSHFSAEAEPTKMCFLDSPMTPVSDVLDYAAGEDSEVIFCNCDSACCDCDYPSLEKITTYIRLAIKAVEQNGLILSDLPFQTDEIALAAVRQDPRAIEYVFRQTPELAMEAIKGDPNCIEFVKAPTEEMFSIAIASDPLSIRFFIQRMNDLTFTIA